ncbi:LLM class flavin-dependent oxidoreductase [Streptomyces mirabilis]|uniref:LLM class flavin-dependent oxidoreductase n=1 Tax=Streptomyces mirabilis TaxID=68239 RepID=UPI0036CB9688
MGERHAGAFLSSGVTVLLGAIAATTSRVRIQTGVSVLSIHAPLRVAEDYATVDQLSRGRLELVIGKGNEMRQLPMFGIENGDQWDAMAEKYELLRRLWREEMVTWEGRFRGPLNEVTSLPRPFAGAPRVWHGSATTLTSATHSSPPTPSSPATSTPYSSITGIPGEQTCARSMASAHPAPPTRGTATAPGHPSQSGNMRAHLPCRALGQVVGPTTEPRPRATTRLHVPRARGARADRAPHGPCAIRLLSQSRILRSRWRWPGCRTAQE